MTKRLTTQFFPVSCYCPNISISNLFSNTLELTFSLNVTMLNNKTHYIQYDGILCVYLLQINM
jgi:hypothetical protein